MVTEGPISCYTITKKVPLSTSSSVLPLCSTSTPPSSQEKERKQKVLGLHHCLHHCDNLHIYLVIFPLFCLPLQSISPALVCAAETCKEVQVVILNDRFFFKVVNFCLPGGAQGECHKGNFTKSGHLFHLLSAVTFGEVQLVELARRKLCKATGRG